MGIFWGKKISALQMSKKTFSKIFPAWIHLFQCIQNNCSSSLPDGGALGQGSPIPGSRTSTGPRPVRNRAAQQEVSGGWASEASSAAPHCSPSPTLPLEICPPTHWSVEKLSSLKPVPDDKNVGDCCSRTVSHVCAACFFCSGSQCDRSPK